MTPFLLMTRTAPGFLVAAKEAKLCIIALVEGAEAHNKKHGDALLRSIIATRNIKAAREASGVHATGAKRFRDIAFIVVSAPPPRRTSDPLEGRGPEARIFLDGAG